LELFFRKVHQLVTKRARDLCANLHIPIKIFHQILQCVFQLLIEHSTLIMGRHLDQIIMCSIYGVCRVNQLGTTFKGIIEQYKSLFQNSSKVNISF
jgi:hypothetical protein